MNDTENFDVAVVQAKGVVQSFEKKFGKDVSKKAFEEVLKGEQDERTKNRKKPS